MTSIIQAVSDVHVQAAKRLFSDYASSLGVDLGFQNFADELAGLPGDYVAPHGALLLAVDPEGDIVGCVALRRFESEVAELKRLYVTEAGRGRGLGRDLTLAALSVARDAGYARVRLDTLPSMNGAQSLYEQLGFYDIDPYRYNPVEATRYMEIEL